MGHEWSEELKHMTRLVGIKYTSRFNQDRSSLPDFSTRQGRLGEAVGGRKVGDEL